MNRRSFMRTLAGAVAGFTVLPPATTYERVWRATRVVQPSIGIRYWIPEEYAGTWRWVVSSEETALALIDGGALQRPVAHFKEVHTDLDVLVACNADIVRA